MPEREGPAAGDGDDRRERETPLHSAAGRPGNPERRRNPDREAGEEAEEMPEQVRLLARAEHGEQGQAGGDR